MRKNISKIIYCVFLFSFLATSLSFGQDETTRNELKMILNRFINYRFGTISIYKVKNISEIRKAIAQKEELASGAPKEGGEIIKTVAPELNNLVQEAVKGGDDIEDIRTEISRRGMAMPDKATLEALFNYYKRQGETTTKIENAYLVTTRPDHGRIPNTIIALIVSTNPSDDMEKVLRRVGNADIYTTDEMRAFKLDTGFTSNNLYDLMANVMIQRNYEEKTLDAQGIGNPQWFWGRKYGVTNSLIKDDDISSYDVQKVMRISEGQALDYQLKTNELIISPDLISWRQYDMPVTYDNSGAMKPDSFSSSNFSLPKFGVELRYGIEDINFPSFWSERLTLAAMWENVKLGIILPTSGWASLSSDVFNQTRKLTYGGVGVSGSFDFPIKIIPKSGIFHMNFGYVFGDAKEAKYKNRFIDPNTYNPDLGNAATYDYLVRADGQLHYTFGVAIDNDYWLRFGIGGTVYNVEKWYNKPSVDTIAAKRTFPFTKDGTETVGGLSGKIEFMSKGISTPFGASIQYFDEALSVNGWLEIPIVANTLAVRLDAKGYFVAFRDKLHPWENSSVFIPMARFIVNF